MSWNCEYEKTLLRLRRKSEAGGGEARMEKQRAKGKLSARQRLALLFDEGSFQEVGAFAAPNIPGEEHYPGDGVITGFGTIDGRLAFAAAEDFTVVGGTMGHVHGEKMCRIADMAYEQRAPFIMLNDGGGARIGEGVASLSGYGGLFRRLRRASGVILQIAAIMGPCAGGACYAPAMCDFVFMVRGTSYMFITGPQVVKTATNEAVSLTELGGADMHMQQSGAAHIAAENDEACLEKIRLLLSYLPFSSGVPAPRTAPLPASAVSLQALVPENPKLTYDMHRVIEALCDSGSFFELQPDFARNILTGFCRMDGKTTGVVASQPNYAGGCIDIHASDKAARFVRFCDCFSIPVVTLVDVPAFLPGVMQERGGIIRHGAKLLYAYAEASVPKITLILRKAYGGAFIALGSKTLGADLVLAWPLAQIGVMGAPGAVDILYAKEIAAAEDPAALREKRIAEYEKNTCSPYAAAELGEIDEVILPEETSGRLRRALRVLTARSAAPAAHGNIPL